MLCVCFVHTAYGGYAGIGTRSRKRHGVCKPRPPAQAQCCSACAARERSRCEESRDRPRSARARQPQKGRKREMCKTGQQYRRALIGGLNRARIAIGLSGCRLRSDATNTIGSISTGHLKTDPDRPSRTRSKTGRHALFIPMPIHIAAYSNRALLVEVTSST